MEIGVIIDLDGLSKFDIPEKDIDSVYSIAIFSEDKNKALEISEKLKTDNTVVLDFPGESTIIEIAEDNSHLDGMYIVSERIETEYTVKTFREVLNNGIK